MQCNKNCNVIKIQIKLKSRIPTQLILQHNFNHDAIEKNKNAYSNLTKAKHTSHESMNHVFGIILSRQNLIQFSSILCVCNSLRASWWTPSPAPTRSQTHKDGTIWRCGKDFTEFCNFPLVSVPYLRCFMSDLVAIKSILVYL